VMQEAVPPHALPVQPQFLMQQVVQPKVQLQYVQLDTTDTSQQQYIQQETSTVQTQFQSTVQAFAVQDVGQPQQQSFVQQDASQYEPQESAQSQSNVQYVQQEVTQLSRQMYVQHEITTSQGPQPPQQQHLILQEGAHVHQQYVQKDPMPVQYILQEVAQPPQQHHYVAVTQPRQYFQQQQYMQAPQQSAHQYVMQDPGQATVQYIPVKYAHHPQPMISYVQATQQQPSYQPLQQQSPPEVQGSLAQPTRQYATQETTQQFTQTIVNPAMQFLHPPSGGTQAGTPVKYVQTQAYAQHEFTQSVPPTAQQSTSSAQPLMQYIHADSQHSSKLCFVQAHSQPPARLQPQMQYVQVQSEGSAQALTKVVNPNSSDPKQGQLQYLQADGSLQSSQSQTYQQTQAHVQYVMADTSRVPAQQVQYVHLEAAQSQQVASVAQAESASQQTSAYGTPSHVQVGDRSESSHPQGVTVQYIHPPCSQGSLVTQPPPVQYVAVPPSESSQVQFAPVLYAHYPQAAESHHSQVSHTQHQQNPTSQQPSQQISLPQTGAQAPSVQYVPVAPTQQMRCVQQQNEPQMANVSEHVPVSAAAFSESRRPSYLEDQSSSCCSSQSAFQGMAVAPARDLEVQDAIPPPPQQQSFPRAGCSGGSCDAQAVPNARFEEMCVSRPAPRISSQSRFPPLSGGGSQMASTSASSSVAVDPTNISPMDTKRVGSLPNLDQLTQETCSPSTLIRVASNCNSNDEYGLPACPWDGSESSLNVSPSTIEGRRFNSSGTESGSLDMDQGEVEGEVIVFTGAAPTDE